MESFEADAPAAAEPDAAPAEAEATAAAEPAAVAAEAPAAAEEAPAPPLRVEPRPEDYLLRIQELEKRILGLEIAHAQHLAEMCRVWIEHRAALPCPPQRNFDQQLRNPLPSGSSAGGPDAAGDEADGAAGDAAPPLRRRRLQ